MIKARMLLSDIFIKTLFLLIALLVSSQIHAECISGDCRYGIGTFRFDNGDKYVGGFIDGSRTGKGTYTWPNGDKYVGGFIDDSRTGKGTYTWPSGDKHVGEWKDNKRHGKGVYTESGGATKTGFWLDSVYFRTEAEWLAEQTKRNLAEEIKRVAEEKARKKYERIYNACLLDKSKEVDMSVLVVRSAVKAACEDIAEDPSWLEELKYD